MRWYRRAADQGHGNASCNLGAMYVNGQGVNQNHAEAIKYWSLAAKQGIQSAQDNIDHVLQARCAATERCRNIEEKVEAVAGAMDIASLPADQRVKATRCDDMVPARAPGPWKDKYVCH